MNVFRRSLLLLIAVLFLQLDVCAQFTKKTVVRLVNRTTGKVVAAGTSTVNCVDRADNDLTQLWYVEDRYYNAIPIGYKVRLRNLATGRYLQGNDKASAPWRTITTSGSYTEVYDGVNTQFTTELWEASRDGYYTLGAKNKKTGNSDYDYDKLHCDASGTCVSWVGAAEASLWTIEVVNGMDVQAQWDKLANLENQTKNRDVYQGYLRTLFTDDLCKELRSEYRSQSALQASSAYQALPQELKDMALKVCNGNWAERNRDNSAVYWASATALRFRVQKVEAYSVAEESCNYIKSSQYSNMNNPVGIYANNMDMLYIMVKGEIKQGASLYVTSLSHNSTSYLTSITTANPVKLVSGLNMVPFYGDKNMLYLLYSVSGANNNHLTGYPDIEVHIEGGCINGLYDSSMDDKSRFNELSNNSSKTGLEYYDVLGKKFAFRTGRATVFDNNDASSIERAIAVWDMIGTTQHLVMGVASTSEMAADPLGLHTYTSDFSMMFNNRQLVHSISNLSYYTQAPYRIQFAHGEGFLRGDVMEKNGYIWGPAHEMGHANQTVINMVGTTEISNNLFSNVAVFYQDYLLSRGGTIADNCAGYRAGTAWHFREADSRMRMLYQLWLYYHAAGNNRNFFPKLFEYLRNDPMSIYPSSSGDVYTSNESLKFYKYACRAAGEDLTPFFESWGFFVPFNKSTIVDYATYSIISNESDIVAAKNEVASYVYRKNYAPIFIEDRIGDVMSRKYSGHKKAWFDKALNVGTTGMYSDFVNDTSIDDEFVWIEKDGGSIEISKGEGIAGVLVENSGKIHSFFNTLVIEGADILNGIKSGSYKLKVVGVDGNLYDVKSIDETESVITKRVVLEAMIEDAEAIVGFVDDECCRVGYYNPAYTAGLSLVLEKAQDAYNNSVSEDYDMFIDKLVDEMNKLKAVGDAAVINISDGYSYMLENKLHSGRLMYLTSNSEIDGMANPLGNSYKWIFEYAGSNSDYYIKSESNGRYVEEMTAYSQQVYADEASKSTADVYSVEIAADRTVSFAGKSYLLHLDSWMNVVGWFSDAEASYWHVRRVDVPEKTALLLKLETLIERVKWLVEEMAVNSSFNGSISVSGVKTRYMGRINSEELSSAAAAVGEAVMVKDKSNVSVSEINSEYNTLNMHYNLLKAAFDDGNNAELRSARQNLAYRINELKTYISGEVAGCLPLQCDNANEDYYISSNAEHNIGGGVSDGGGLSALIDDSPSTYFHSRWAGDVVNEPHCLQVDLGTGNSVTEFCFNYSLRKDLYHTVPTEIIVSGSNDGVTFKNITTLGRDVLLGGASSDVSVAPDYQLNSDFETATKSERKLSAVKLYSPGCGEQTVQLTDTDKLYNDLTDDTFNVLPGETLTASFVKDGEWSWLHGYIYIDADNNGFTASLNGTLPEADLVSYSFYGSESNENNGYNSVGTSLSGDSRDVLDPPSFKAPTTPGLYRIRYKADWNSIDPKGDNNSNFGGTIADVSGSIVDVMLRVGAEGNTGINSSFTSDTIHCEQSYRYLRFTVSESACFVDSHNCTDDHMKYNGYYFFSMSQFGLTKFDSIETAGTWGEFYLEDAETVLDGAERVLSDATSVVDINNCADEVQRIIEILKKALATPLPVELTAEQSEPSLYRILLAEGNLPLEYETAAVPNMYDPMAASLNLVSFGAGSSNSPVQAWYFMKGSDVGQYYIYPLSGEGRVLGSNPEWSQVMQPGDERVWGVYPNETGYITEWTMEYYGDGIYILAPVYSTTVVLGRYALHSQKLGFVSGAMGNYARFIFEKMDEVDTAIEDVVTDVPGDESVLYDIFGRRVKTIKSPGFYIQNGKKIYVAP